MKKFLYVLSAIACSAAIATCAFGCSKNKSSSVTLTEVGQDGIGLINGISYYVVPEPAATAKVTRLTQEGQPYYNVGSVQSLYGENGYPQAVLVAKKSLIEEDGKFVKEFINEFKSTAQWLSSRQSYSDVVNKINANGGTSLKAPMVSKTVVENCSINYVKAPDDKVNVIDYMNSVKTISSAMYGSCDDSFFCDVDNLGDNENESKTTVSVYMPDGAPALAMAKMMVDEGVQLSKSVNYNVVVAETITTHVKGNNENDNADLCVLPVNVAAKFLGDGSKYKLLGTVTHGNLFIISNKDTPLTSENIATALKGKKVGVVSLSNVPGLTFKMVLNKYSIKYETENK